MNDDEYRISQFKKALRQHTESGYVDLDKSYSFKFNFQIHRYEDILRNSKMAAPPNRWSFHRICFLTQGEGDLILGIYKFKVTKNTFFVIPSRVISSSKNWTMDSKGYVVLFNNEFFLQNNFSHQLIANKRILTSSIQPNMKLSDDEAQEVIRIFENLLVEKKRTENINNELIAIKILELLNLGERMIDQSAQVDSNPNYADVIMRFIDLLELHFTKEHSVKFYAEQLAIHPNHLNALIKKQTGISAKESIQNKLLLETKYLLHSTKLPIKQISNQMGFSDPNYFTTFFKKAENLSPVNYRSSFD